MNILEILSIARAWKATAEVAKEAVSRLKDTQWDRPRKLRATVWQLASELELAAAEGNIETVNSWRNCKKQFRSLKTMRRSTQQFEAPFSVLISRAKAIKALSSVVKAPERRFGFSCTCCRIYGQSRSADRRPLYWPKVPSILKTIKYHDSSAQMGKCYSISRS